MWFLLCGVSFLCVWCSYWMKVGSRAISHLLKKNEWGYLLISIPKLLSLSFLHLLPLSVQYECTLTLWKLVTFIFCFEIHALFTYFKKNNLSRIYAHGVLKSQEYNENKIPVPFMPRDNQLPVSWVSFQKKSCGCMVVYCMHSVFFTSSRLFHISTCRSTSF